MFKYLVRLRVQKLQEPAECFVFRAKEHDADTQENWFLSKILEGYFWRDSQALNEVIKGTFVIFIICETRGPTIIFISVE